MFHVTKRRRKVAMKFAHDFSVKISDISLRPEWSVINFTIHPGSQKQKQEKVTLKNSWEWSLLFRSDDYYKYIYTYKPILMKSLLPDGNIIFSTSPVAQKKTLDFPPASCPAPISAKLP